ncbi:hypothetical protein FLP41_17300 [Paracoccus marcusii]|uniref:hypothetical protein n=1 Tax=Paracoccus marcusii TaxID=59779 RepID=UPI002ED2888C|nr:hypothetical protein FLP41_17300 [Paracoccus marcusii]
MIDLEAMIEREPVTVVLSKMGWIRTLKGHQPLDAELKFKDGDGPGQALHAETTDKLMIFASNGRFYTLPVNTLPGGRGMGEPLRLMVDLPNEAQVIAMFPWREGRSIWWHLGRATGSSWARGHPGSDQDREAGPEWRRAAVSSGIRRPRRRGWRKPKDAGLSLGRTARDGTRQGRAAAALWQGRRAGQG